MDSISFFFPSHLLIPCIISLFLLILLLFSKKKYFSQLRWLWISLIVFLGVYLFIILYSVYLSNHYQWELQKFDLDSNGSFSAEERTPEQQSMQLKVTGDTARNLSFITGLIMAFIIAGITFIGGRLYTFYSKKGGKSN